MRRPWLTMGFAAALLAASGARAEQLVLTLSSQRVAISSNFTGTELAVFGIVERDGQSVARTGAYDVVLTVRGPREAITIRRKDALGPIWINRDQQKFVGVPTLLAIYATRPLADIVSETLQRRNRIGVSAIVSGSDFTYDRGMADDAFRAALVRLKARDNLYVERGRGVEFVTDTAFRARIPLPATAPLGDYDIEAAVISGGAVLTRETTHFSVMKAGFEEQITALARDHSLVYGLATAALALAFGWIASVIFRRD
jgi:uncharacterized protein (TIGR02186 family)